MNRPIVFLCVLFTSFVFSTTDVHSLTLFEDNFDSHSGTGTSGLSTSNIFAWGTATLDLTGGNGGSKGSKVAYDVAGGNSGLSLKIAPLNLGELYIRFYAKVDCGTGQCTGGTKFLKFFSINNGGYANSTMRLVYETGDIEGIASGNGSTTLNDDGNVMFLNGNAPYSPNVNMNISEVNYTGTYSGHKDKQWHCYEVFMKYNTNDNSDGEYKLWIDGTLKLHATNVKNRNNANVRQFDTISLGGYSSSAQWKSPYTIWFDNIVISSQYIGPLTSVKPPTNLNLIKN